MSEYQILAVFSVFALLYSAVASRLERTPLSGAVVYVAAGMLLGPRFLGFVDFGIEADGLQLLAELALAVCLFADSANADLGVLRRIEALPIRLLLLGLPLTIVAGFGCGWILFDDLQIVEVALIAAMLAPTDAALGKAVVTNARVPGQIRESLNVESGLNDGICVPIILFLIGLCAGDLDGNSHWESAVMLTVQVIGLGAVVGLGLSGLSAMLLRRTTALGWVDGTWLQVPVIALSLTCFSVAQWLGGSGFIASFAGGLLFGGLVRKHRKHLLEAAEGTSDTLAMVTWFAFGTILTTQLFQALTWQVLVYAIASLTVIRMIPVALCLTGKRLSWDSLVFMGWFGPRGLASIVFLVMVIAEETPGHATITSVVSWTITLSVIAHGISANPLVAWFGDRVRHRGDVI